MSLGQSGTTAELVKWGADQMNVRIHELVKAVWIEKKARDDWKKSIIVPIYKKGIRTQCDNYRGINVVLEEADL